MMRMRLIMGVKKKYETDGVRLLVHVLHRYSLFADKYTLEYCYDTEPPTRAKERAELVKRRRTTLERDVLEEEESLGPIVGCGWMACELLTGKGKTRLKDMVGTRWTYVGNITRSVWLCNDPSGALYNPNLVVDIAAVVRAAGVEAGFLMNVNKAEPAFSWAKWI
jgi:hypothetical protein